MGRGVRNKYLSEDFYSTVYIRILLGLWFSCRFAKGHLSNEFPCSRKIPFLAYTLVDKRIIML